MLEINVLFDDICSLLKLLVRFIVLSVLMNSLDRTLSNYF